MSNNSDGNQKPQSAKVLKLGLNISVSGDPGTDFEIVLDDKEQKALQSTSQREEQHRSFDTLELEDFRTDVPKHEIEKSNKQEVMHAQPTGAIPKHNSLQYSAESPKISDSEYAGNSTSKETNLISSIKTTMEHFEKFSDHIKEIPRLRNHPLATSTPFSDKYNSKSESSLVHAESRPKKFSHLYDYSRKEYFKSSVKPSPPDLFLKPLPAEGYYKRGIYTRYFDYFDLEPYRHYCSDNSLNKSSEFKSFYDKSNYDYEKYERNLPPEPPSGILKKSDSESGDKQSTSSAESTKDIKIYQSGGILIMQNFKKNLNMSEKKEISEFSAKLIENCNRLKMETVAFQEDKPAICNFSDENKSSVKMVQFDLPELEGQRSKFGDSSFNAGKDESSLRMESSEFTRDCMKNKDSSPQGMSQSQDFPSISTQDNDSTVSNPCGMSPTCESSKKLEWDSGADIGYLNLDLTKENLSTIEKIVLKGLSSDGTREKNVVYEKKQEQNQSSRSKFILERMPSDLVVQEIVNVDVKPDDKGETFSIRKRQEKEEKSSNSSEDGREKKKSDRKNNSKENYTGEIRPKLEDAISSSNKNPATKPNDAHTKELTDKSVNVNTLFESEAWKISPDQSAPKEVIKPTHKKTSLFSKTKSSRNKNKAPPQRLLKASKKPPLLTSYIEMGNPKKVYKKVEATPTLNDLELSREVDEIIIDQRFKIKQNLASGREGTKETETSVRDKAESSKEVKTKSRPISASSSSNNTVLPKSEREDKTKKAGNKFTDQIIQTSDYDCESIGIQAFASQVSSDCDFKSLWKNVAKPAAERECVNTSSKNIQAFGLNSSLPKQLEHQKGIEVIDNQHTKSTQYFGGPLNSLPNYHCNLVTKPGECCGRSANILKPKKSSETEIIRVKEQNEKNILANDSPKSVETKKDSRRLSNNENKENLISQKSTNSKKIHGNASRKHDSEKTSTKEKKKIQVDVADTCDDVSSLVLTTENLKEHGESIDRNIIQEKYFQSQLVELEKKKMISRSTSMEIQLEIEGDGKNYMSTGCQYSPQSKGPEDDFAKENSNEKTRKKPPLEQLLSEYICQNAEEEAFGTIKSTNQEQAGDSLPSSTQTAHSWVPGVQNPRENSNGVGKARSFEYLPGHIYESSGNLREELPSETEQNLITSSSDSDTAKGSISNRGDSEGRNTLILENSTEYSHDSDRMKILDENLTQLNFAVLKLWEKDAQVQDITRSLLAKLRVKCGSGDWLPLGVAEASKTEVGESKDLTDYGQGGDTMSADTEISTQMSKDKEKEFSIACQTEGNSPSPDPENFFEEKKALEKRISKEKQCQIKWIENEIQQLNILRELLEKQSSSVQRKKKHSFLSVTSNEASKSEENYLKNISTEIHSRPVTPAYGCTISLMENMPPKSSQPSSDVNQHSKPCPSQYGMSVSLSGCSNNVRRVVMLPIGVQVSLKDSSSTKDGNNEEMNKETFPTSPCRSPLKSNHVVGSQTHASTQFPSIRRPSGVSAQTDFPSPTRSNQCNKDNCYSINLSEKTFSSSSRSKVSDKRGSSRLCFIGEESDTENENRTANLTDECIETDNGQIPQQVKEEKINADLRLDLSSNCAISKSKQIKSCRCQNCSKTVSSTTSKSCQRPCESNIYLNCSRASEDSKGCRCSRVKVQKWSHCSCHVIKIHGPKCSSSERGSCSCKRRNQSPLKKTETQSCQTDSAEVVTKELVKYLEITKPTEAPEIKQPFARKVAMECKKAVDKKFLCNPKVSYERTEPCEDDQFVMEKGGFVKETIQDAPPSSNCNCKRKVEKEKPDEHPRHYFLRIEETEVEECANEAQQKNSLEVITVKVPFKKAGKGKIYCGDLQQFFSNTQNIVKSSEEPSNGCNCNCISCADNNRRLEQDNNSRCSPLYRTQAEKPESPPIRVSHSPYESASPSFAGSRPSREANPRPDLFRPQTPMNDFRASQCCEECGCMNKSTPSSRDIQSEYDSHKKSSYAREHYNYGGNANRYEGKRASEQSGKPICYDEGRYSHEWDLNPRQSRAQGLNGNTEQYSPDYYNYNKREFMTKSEIMKEEQQKGKVRQPSLQECLSSNRPDFYSSAEKRRQIISERTKERVKRHNDRMECLIKMVKHCSGNEQFSNAGSKRIFTTSQMREQTLKKYKNLPEVTDKIADEKKKSEYKTNRIMADIFAKKLQIEALKGHINLSNSVSVLYTI